MKRIPALSIGYLLLYIFFAVVFVTSACTTAILIAAGDYYYLILAIMAAIYAVAYMLYYYRIYVGLSPSKIVISRITFYDAETADCKWWETLAFRAKGKVQRLDNFSFDPAELERYGYNKDVGIVVDKQTEADMSYPYEVTFILKSGEKISWNIKPYSGDQITRILRYIKSKSSVSPTGHLSQYL